MRSTFSDSDIADFQQFLLISLISTCSCHILLPSVRSIMYSTTWWVRIMWLTTSDSIGDLIETLYHKLVKDLTWCQNKQMFLLPCKTSIRLFGVEYGCVLKICLTIKLMHKILRETWAYLVAMCALVNVAIVVCDACNVCARIEWMLPTFKGEFF